MNGTLITQEELAEIKKLLKQADEAIINNVYAKSKIKEALKKLNKQNYETNNRGYKRKMDGQRKITT